MAKPTSYTKQRLCRCVGRRPHPSPLVTMSIEYKDVAFPHDPPRSRMLLLDDEGRMLVPGASSGELAFARLGKSIVDNAWLIDSRGREELVRLIRCA